MLSKEELKEKLSVLIDKYKALSESDIEEKSEDDVRRLFINRLLVDVFEWDDNQIKNQRTVESQESLEHSDYEYPKHPKIIVEAKKFALDKKVKAGDFDEQVKRYAYFKPVYWAVLTDFKQFKAWYITRERRGRAEYIFCNLDLLEDNLDNVIDKLQWFQNDNLLYGGIEMELKTRGVLPKETEITDDFSYNLNTLRQDLLQHNYFGVDSLVKKEELVQGLINRLIFIKKIEAEQLEPMELENIYRCDYDDYYSRIIKLFEKYRKKYDTDIFGDEEVRPDLEQISIQHEVIRNVLDTISRPKKGGDYNFKAIDVDVLGSVYENYLAYVQKRASQTESNQKKKQHGIYYTPQYMVDFLVNKAISERLKDLSVLDVEKLTVIDPACGSGSFLINTIDKFNNYYEKHIKDYNYFTILQKMNIIKKNIYGIDLDEKAVRIAELSIYLKMLASLRAKQLDESKTPVLPHLSENMKSGDSIIDDKSIKADAFLWNKEFEKIMNSGGFDIIIGNPPWSAKISTKINKQLALRKGLDSANVNICSLFVIEALEKLKSDGTLSFLLPKQFIKNEAYYEVRKRILEEFQIAHLIDFGKFPHVASDAIGLVVKKTHGNSKIKRHFFKDQKLVTEAETMVEQNVLKRSPIKAFSFSVTKEIQDILDKISKDSSSLGDLSFKIKRGIELGQESRIVKCASCGNYNEAEKKYYSKKEKVCKFCKHLLAITGNGELEKDPEGKISYPGKDSFYKQPCYAGNQVQRYYLEKPHYIPLKLQGVDYKEDAFNGNKILVKRIDTKINGAFSDKELSAFNTVYSIYNPEKTKEDFMYLLGVLNSRVMCFYYGQTYNLGMHLTTQVTIEELSKMPIKLSEGKEKKEMVRLVGKISILAQELYEKTDEERFEWKKRKGEEIKETSNRIDDLVYKIYGITTEEQKTIEAN